MWGARTRHLQRVELHLRLGGQSCSASEVIRAMCCWTVYNCYTGWVRAEAPHAKGVRYEVIRAVMLEDRLCLMHGLWVGR